MTMPTFIIGGAPKSGTTALWYYLNAHPDVNLGKNKEIRFFSNVNKGALSTGLTTFGPIRPGLYSKGLKWYESFFDDSKQYKAYGEASTHYFSAHDSASLIKKDIPNVKLIFMLRDPVARLYSHYWEEYKMGIDMPDFETMVKNNHPRFQWYSFISSYKVNLERFLLNFSEHQILVLIMDDLKNSPNDVFRSVCNFLNIDNMEIPVELNKKYNQQTAPRNRNLEKIITYTQNSTIAQNLPLKIREKLGVIRRKLSAANAINYDYPKLSNETRSFLIKPFIEDVKFVETFIGRNLDKWRIA